MAPFVLVIRVSEGSHVLGPKVSLAEGDRYGMCLVLDPELPEYPLFVILDGLVTDPHMVPDLLRGAPRPMNCRTWISRAVSWRTADVVAANGRILAGVEAAEAVSSSTSSRALV